MLAQVRTKNVTVAGFVRGDIIATGRLKIMASGRLEGDARVGSLVVQEGGVHLGAIKVHPEGIPAEEPLPVAEPVAMVQPEGDTTTYTGDRVVADPVGRVKKFWGEFF